MRDRHRHKNDFFDRGDELVVFCFSCGKKQTAHVNGHTDSPGAQVDELTGIVICDKCHLILGNMNGSGGQKGP